PEQPESSNDIYLEEQGDTNITIDSLDLCYDRDHDDQDDTDELDQERDLLASLIQKLKCEIDDSKNHHVSSDPGPQCSTTVLEQDNLSPGTQSQENVPQVAEIVTTSNELELLYSPMFSELLNGTSHVVSKSSAVHAADNPDKRQQHNT
ncbi:hypothetical protein Tco_0193339, partial [Tanacetum coccineum]